MSLQEDRLVAVAQAEDTYDLLQHIAWTDILLPQLELEKKGALEAIAAYHLGTPLPNGMTVEKLAGKAYGINYVIKKIENVLSRGKKALGEIEASGIHIT
jgi:hypothetical protein